MQEHEYESIASEPESIFVAQDRWSIGEKLQVGPKHRSRFASLALAILPALVVVCVLLAVFFILGSFAFVHSVHHVSGAIPRRMFPGGPGPIQQP